MSMVEGLALAVILLLSAAVVIRRMSASFGGEKGSCRSCGPTCGCEIKSRINEAAARMDQDR